MAGKLRSGARHRVTAAALVALVLCALAPAPARAQPVAWAQRLVSGPAGRGDLALAYDSIRQLTVLFGGTTDGFNGTSDTWEWNGVAWNQRSVAAPPARLLNALAYDSSRQVTVLFGGINQNTIYGDTWEWDGAGGGAWTQRQVSGPSARWAHTMAFDSFRGVTVLFGGYTGPAGGHNDETWEWNGSAWSQRASGPPRRFGSGMAYDSARHVTVLFGGSNAGSPNLSDTWEWNGTAWTQRLVSGPSARYFHTMAYDAGRGVTVLFGGTNGSGIPTNETWEWNGTGGGSWTQRNIPGPTPREAPAMAYDAARSKTVLFGGYSAGWNGETWELGASCAGPSITTQPISQTGCPGGTVTFSVAATGSSPLSYQWQIETASGVWQTLGNDPFPLSCAGGGGGAFAFATPLNSPTVQIGIHPCPGVSHYQIRCIISNSCGSVTSNEVTDTLCVADFDNGSGTGVCDGGVGIEDLLYYLTVYSAGTTRADVDDGSGTGHPDGGVGIEDLLYYLVRYNAGC